MGDLILKVLAKSQALLRETFLFETLPDRKRYLLLGLFWMVIKYAGDAAIFWFFEHRLLLPQEFLNPMLSNRWPDRGMPPNYLIVHVLWAIPFVWAGFSLSVRRAIDAGEWPWWAFLFFVPFLNFVLMIGLCIPKSSPEREWKRENREKKKIFLREALATLIVGAVLSTGVMAILIYAFQSYSSALFIGVPFVYGFVVTVAINFPNRRTLGAGIALTLASQLMAAGLLILFAMEGAICIAMAVPVFLAMSLAGAVAGDLLVATWHPKKPPSPTAVYSLFIVPLIWQPFASLQERDLATPLHEVLTSIEIEAPPEKVWPHVVQFSELPPPTEWIFKLGVAHPLRAKIEGHGVGAVRRCQFSTGDFIEPITVWSEPSELSFDVAFQPRPMDELSIYDKVYAPHLDNFITSERGQFKLVALPGGRTRLEGRTWFRINIHPVSYWSVFADELIHRIHQRVLAHIQIETQAGG